MCKLIAITNRKLCKGDFLKQIERLAKSGVDRIVLREKDLSERDYLKLAKDVKEVCDAYQTPLFLHKYLYCYGKLPTAGIHLSLTDAMKYRETLKAVPCVGISTHSLEQIELAETSGADYVFYGHIFETACKEGMPPRGLKLLELICRESQIPVYGIGGINEENIQKVFAAGAKGACIMSLGMTAEEARLRDLVQMKNDR